jgi:hypothetical protein
MIEGYTLAWTDEEICHPSTTCRASGFVSVTCETTVTCDGMLADGRWMFKRSYLKGGPYDPDLEEITLA